MSFWVRHPRTKQEDSMLTAAIAGFLFSIMFVTAAFVVAFVSSNPAYLDNVALIVGAIISPTVGAYTVRKYTDFKNHSDNLAENTSLEGEDK